MGDLTTGVLGRAAADGQPIVVFLFAAAMCGGFWIYGYQTGRMPMRDGRVIDSKKDAGEFGCAMGFLLCGWMLSLAAAAVSTVRFFWR